MRVLLATVFVLVCSARVAADTTYAASIKGVIYEEGLAPVEVRCKPAHASVRAAGDVAVDPTIKLKVGSQCPLLHEMLGSLRCWTETLERDLSAVTVHKPGGAASHLKVIARQAHDSDEGPVPIQLEYTVKFQRDKSTGELIPPLTKIKGRLIIPPRPGEPRLFVGEFTAPKRKPRCSPPGVPCFSEYLHNCVGEIPPL